MKLLFLRHADALDGEIDDLRPLSDKGHRDSDRIGQFLKRAGFAFDVVYTSPLKRAIETAGGVLKHVEAQRVEAVDAMTNEYADFSSWILNLPSAETVLLVGHNPSISERVCSMIGMPHASCLNMPKGGLICIETANRRFGMLKFFVHPKILTSIV